MKNAINWFEIPASNFDRAVTFYNIILNTELHREVIAGIPNAIFPNEGDEAVGGSVVLNPQLSPSSQGSTVYLNAGGDMTAIYGRIIAAGGQCLTPIIDFPFGKMAFFLDTEGNRVGLHTT